MLFEFCKDCPDDTLIKKCQECPNMTTLVGYIKNAESDWKVLKHERADMRGGVK